MVATCRPTTSGGRLLLPRESRCDEDETLSLFNRLGPPGRAKAREFFLDHSRAFLFSGLFERARSKRLGLLWTCRMNKRQNPNKNKQPATRLGHSLPSRCQKG